MFNGCRRDSRCGLSCARSHRANAGSSHPPTSGSPGRLPRHFTAALSLITGEFLQAALIITSRRGKAAHASDSEGPSRMTHLCPSQPHKSLFHNTALSTTLSFTGLLMNGEARGLFRGAEICECDQVGLERNLHRSMWAFLVDPVPFHTEKQAGQLYDRLTELSERHLGLLKSGASQRDVHWQ